MSCWCHLGPLMPPWSSMVGQFCSGVNALPGPCSARVWLSVHDQCGCSDKNRILFCHLQRTVTSSQGTSSLTQCHSIEQKYLPCDYITNFNTVTATWSIGRGKKELKQSLHSDKAKVFRLIIFLYKTGHVSLGVQMPVLCTSLQHTGSDTRVMELLPITNAKRSDTHPFSNNICCTWTWRV